MENNRASAEAQKSEQEQTLGSTVNTLEILASENQALHLQCDFIVRNFDVRRQARAGELEGIKQAKAVLSGADFQ
jgi:hypothetical protein